jgi:hypothetical protein
MADANLPTAVVEPANRYLGGSYLTVVIVLLILVIYLWWTRRSEHNTMPTTTMRAQQQDTVHVSSGLGGAAQIIQGEIVDLRERVGESMAGGVPAALTSAVDPMSAIMPGSPAWQVLNNPAMGCMNRDLEASADYQAYQLAASRQKEGMDGVGGGVNDQALRQAMNGM